MHFKSLLLAGLALGAAFAGARFAKINPILLIILAAAAGIILY